MDKPTTYQVRFANVIERDDSTIPVGKIVMTAVPNLEHAIADIKENAYTPYIDIWRIDESVPIYHDTINLPDPNNFPYWEIPSACFQFSGKIKHAHFVEAVPGAVQMSVICQKNLQVRQNFRGWLEACNQLAILKECNVESYSFGKTLLDHYRKCTQIQKTLDDYISMVQLPVLLHANSQDVEYIIASFKDMELASTSGAHWEEIYDEFKAMTLKIEEMLNLAKKYIEV